MIEQLHLDAVVRRHRRVALGHMGLHSTAQRSIHNAANSTRKPSPVVLTSRPSRSAIAESNISACTSLRLGGCALVPPDQARVARHVGGIGLRRDGGQTLLSLLRSFVPRSIASSGNRSPSNAPSWAS